MPVRASWVLDKPGTPPDHCAASPPRRIPVARIMVIASYAPSLIVFRGDMLRAFRDRGHEVVACSPDPDRATLDGLAELGVAHRSYRLQRAGLNPLADLTTYRDLRRLVEDEGPDHVLAYTIKPVIYGCLAAARAGVPHVFAMITGLGTAFLPRGPRARALSTVAGGLYRKALKGCRGVFFQNPDDRDLFLARKIVDLAKCMMINGSGINLDRFPRVGIPSGPPVFLSIARLIADKGIRVYAAAAERVRRDHPAARFRLTGFFEDHPRAIPEAEIRDLVRAGVLEFTGPLEDVRPELAGCTVYCLPTTHREGLPRTVLEAMATGRPVVTSDTPGCRETVVEGRNGFLVPPGDVAALAGTLARYCREPDLAAAQGAASRALAEERFDVHAVNAAIIAGMGL